MKQTNTYIIGYSIVLVVVVAVVLSLVTPRWAPVNTATCRLRKMSDILGSVGLYDAEAADKAKDKNQYIINTYKKYITESFPRRQQRQQDSRLGAGRFRRSRQNSR